jgi:hypothetical protein
MVDGGALSGVTISNIAMTNVSGPIFVRLGNRARPFQAGMQRPGPGRLRDVSISDVQATGADRTGCAIVGLPDHPVGNVRLRNIRIGFAGGGRDGDAKRPVPEKPEAYPEYSMFGVLPAYGFYCRHARQLTLENIDLTCAAPESRPALVCDDVEELRVSAWTARGISAPGPVVSLVNVRNALLDRCQALEDTGTFLRVSGQKTGRVRLLANDFGRLRRAVETAADVQSGAVRLVPK